TATATASLPGQQVQATLDHSDSAAGAAQLFVATYATYVAGIDNLFYDLRTINAHASDQVTATFGFIGGNPLALLFFDGTQFEPIAGSTRVPDSILVDFTLHIIRVILDDTSTPRVTSLDGIVTVVGGNQQITIAATSSANPSLFGQPVTFTVIVGN